MTPDEVAAVERSLRTLEGRMGDVARAFYRRLFAAHPELRLLFTASLEEQERKFAAQLHEIVRAVGDVPAFLSRSATLGGRHQRYGVRSRHYALAADPLVESLAEALGTDWTHDTERAWRRAYALVSEGMLQGAAAAPRS